MDRLELGLGRDEYPNNLAHPQHVIHKGLEERGIFTDEWSHRSEFVYYEETKREIKRIHISGLGLKVGCKFMCIRIKEVESRENEMSR